MSEGLNPGTTLGRYEILGEIGSGGMAVVYRAHDRQLDRIVALKVLPHTVNHNDKFVSRFLSEARTVARLSHPNIVQVHDIGQDQGSWYISMEMVSGVNLAEYLQEEKPNLDQSVRIALQIAQAIAYTHQHGVMHRDLKPSNVLMRGDVPVVIDFGLAKDTLIQGGSLMTRDGEMVGSPAYMSPEQAEGAKLDPRTDICSLGILLYELIAFKNPYLDPRSIHQTLLNVLAADPVPLRDLCPWLDRNLDAVVAKAMARDRERRYATMAEFAQDLKAWLDGTPVSAKPLKPWERVFNFVRRHHRYVWIPAAVIALLAVGGIVQHRLEHTPWAPYAEETFTSPSPQISFESFDMVGPHSEQQPVPSSSWAVKNGALVGRSHGLSYARSREEFLGSIRMEFTVEGLDGNNHDFNVFLQGESPSDGIRFYLGQWGSQRSGIDIGARTAYKWLPATVSLEAGCRYNVAVERDGQALRLYVDGKLIDQSTRVLPATRASGYHLGFFTWNGAVAVRNVKVWRRTVALQASPTVVGDAFLDEGFQDHALNSYQALIQSYPSHRIAQEAQLKMGSVMLARNQIKQAHDIFETVLQHPRSKDIKVRAYFLESLAEQSAGDMLEAQKKQHKVAKLSPSHPANVALIQNQLERIEPCLDPAQPMFFGCASDGETVFKFLTEEQKKRQALFGPVHARFLESLRLWSGVASDTSILNAGFKYESYYLKKDPEVAGQIRLVEGRWLRDQEHMDEAKAAFRDVAEGDDYSDAVAARCQAMIELGRTEAWSGHPAEAQKWFNKVVDDGSAPDAEVNQALFELGVTTVLASEDASSRWKAILEHPTAPWTVRQEASFFLGRIDETALRQALTTPEGAAPEIALILAINALQKHDFRTWHGFVDEYVRRYPYSTSLWDLRRVMNWASQHTPEASAVTARSRRRG